jgi:hypothetical protein
MPFAGQILIIAGQSRFTIKTHAAFKVGNRERYGVILSNNPQLSAFRNQVKSGHFAGVSGSKKRVIGVLYGLILPSGEYEFIRIRIFSIF